MQSFKIVLRLLPEVRSGLKTHTLRWREKQLVPGPMLYVNASDGLTDLLHLMERRIPFREPAGNIFAPAEFPEPLIFA